MANQEDMYRDIEELEEEGEEEQAEALMDIYCEAYSGSGRRSEKTNKLVESYEKKYGRMDNYLR
jgi:hypothetical protein